MSDKNAMNINQLSNSKPKKVSALINSSNDMQNKRQSGSKDAEPIPTQLYVQQNTMGKKASN